MHKTLRSSSVLTRFPLILYPNLTRRLPQRNRSNFKHETMSSWWFHLLIIRKDFKFNQTVRARSKFNRKKLLLVRLWPLCPFKALLKMALYMFLNWASRGPIYGLRSLVAPDKHSKCAFFIIEALIRLFSGPFLCNQSDITTRHQVLLI